MLQRSLALGKRLFPERQILLRSGARLRYIALPAWSQVVAVAICAGLLGSAIGITGAYYNLHRQFHRQAEEASIAARKAAAVVALREQLAAADEQFALMSAQFDEARAQLDAAAGENDRLRSAIDSAEKRAKQLGNVKQLNKDLADKKNALHQAETERAGLQKKLGQLEQQSKGANSKAAEMKLALDTKELQLRELASERDRLRQQLERQTLALAPVPAPAKPAAPALSGGFTSLEQLIVSTGVNVDRLLGDLGAAPAGQGGPFIALNPKRSAADEQRRTQELQKIVKSLPLAAPLAHFQVESGFGPRIDPFRHRSAFHSGVDLSAPYKTPVLATAPGTVTFTGSKDAYGRVVEISHGHGIVTRYAHLHRIQVALGQKVGQHQVIGELGSTGRSTGPHVHYEVLVDGIALDPEKFMEAGKGVSQVTGK